ncbi:MAG: type II toxin-antitoxin system RelE/ParE family toxin [Gammaproteobacteria bacterium]|nr:type II toxin-antitoxin system RelE/ParE family toxin [Gammaproteobacteria bacterium]MDE0441641.1 type II toxin-antitoxin system RelE/ParE family toxin [Gammaproteobacteria bacterium]
MRFAHKGLRSLYQTDRSFGLPQDLVPRIRRILADLDVAARPRDLGVPGYRLHPLKGTRQGQWSIRVSANWRIVFRFEGGEPVDVDFVDYH